MSLETDIPEVLIIEPKLFGDQRGFFLETYQFDTLCRAWRRRGLSCRIICRGRPGACFGAFICRTRSTQGKLVSVLRGRVLDVAVDVRLGSPTFGRHVAVELSEENRRQLWVPRGFAHGFAVLSETADFFYKCDDLYSPKDEISVRWNDPRSASIGGSKILRCRRRTPPRRCWPTSKISRSMDRSDADIADGSSGAVPGSSSTV